MTVYITFRASKEWSDLLFPYFDKLFQVVFNDYEILVNGFRKYELKKRSEYKMLLWEFHNVESKDYDDIFLRIQRGIPESIDCVVSKTEPYPDEYKEVK